MSVKPVDTYIINSVRLFEVNPSETTVSITYKCPENVKKTLVTFKTHNSHLDTNYKFSTNKSKDVSRLLNALGPRGVSVVPAKIQRKARSKNSKQSVAKNTDKKIKKTKIVDTIGLGSLMVNTKVEEFKPVETIVANQDIGNNSSASKKKNKKNKNKKKR